MRSLRACESHLPRCILLQMIPPHLSHLRPKHRMFHGQEQIANESVSEIRSIRLLLPFRRYWSAFFESIPACGSSLYQYLGRWDRSEPARPKHAWPGVYVCARFTGTSIGVRMDDHLNYYNIYIRRCLCQHPERKPARRARLYACGRAGRWLAYSATLQTKIFL
jgi:hypothetical protein